MLSENICYGSSHPIESIVLMILLYSEHEALSKNTTAKLTGALENFLDHNHHLFAIAVGKHKDEEFMAVACMCLEFLSRDQVSYWKGHNSNNISNIQYINDTSLTSSY